MHDELGFNKGPTHTYKQLAHILEKKWTTNTLLQRKVITLEAQIDRLSKALESSPQFQSRNRDPFKWLPVQPAHTLKSHRAAITSVAFHPTFSSLASSSEDCTIKIWNWELGELENTFKGHTATITGLDFGGQIGRTLLASCSNDLLIKLWDPTKGYANIRTLSGHDHTVSCVRFLTPNQNTLVSASRDTSIRFWDILTGTCVKMISTDCGWIRDLAPSYDGRWLVSCGSDHNATIWNVASGSCQTILRGHGNHLECCAFAPPTSYSHLVALMDAKEPPVGYSLGFVATAGRDKTIKLWDLQGVLIKTLVGHDSWVRGLVFHPGGRFLLSIGDDRTIRCWNLAEGARLWKTLDNIHDGFVSCICWAPCAVSLIERHSSSKEFLETHPVPEHEMITSDFPCVLATGSTDSKVHVYA
ncbi:nuclear migration protein NudF [Penicillium angulare]|uniref:nuclear migration protein NudF n=1 Tax=Penicillium angulare TaxID=116970 RepID=UPI0025422DC4|nr:nuclear migration protein NudF [Penicillium angulare]KAJ5279878.1 nuclear migration protein NudF [Penicillium angulare]